MEANTTMPLIEAPKMTSLAGAGSHCAISEGIFTILMAPSTVGIYLLNALILMVLLLAVVEALRHILQFILQLTAILISIYLAVIVYAVSFLIVAGPIMIGQPLDHALVWQQKTMRVMNSCISG